MVKKLLTGLLIILLLAGTTNSALAKGKGKGKRRPPVTPEPISSLLFLTSGATYLGMRIWKRKRNVKLLAKGTECSNSTS